MGAPSQPGVMTTPPVFGMSVRATNALHRLTGHTDAIVSIALSPDGATLATGSWDTTVRLWDVNTGSELRTFTVDIRMKSMA